MRRTSIITWRVATFPLGLGAATAPPWAWDLASGGNTSSLQRLLLLALPQVALLDHRRESDDGSSGNGGGMTASWWLSTMLTPLAASEVALSRVVTPRDAAEMLWALGRIGQRPPPGCCTHCSGGSRAAALCRHQRWGRRHHPLTLPGSRRFLSSSACRTWPMCAGPWRHSASSRMGA